MVTPPKREYRYLDTEADRLAFIEDMRQIRREVLAFAQAVPKDQWYTPRYHGWSLAAMLGHLQLMDNLSLWLVQLGTMGISLPISAGLLDSFNDVMSRVFKARVVETTLKGLARNEDKLTAYVQRLPIDKYSKLVYDPAISQYLTVEQAIQELFVFHWRDHFETIRQTDDQRFVEPPTSSLV